MSTGDCGARGTQVPGRYEIAGAALTEAGIRLVLVTHLYDLAERYYEEHDRGMLFLRAERQPDGQRTFRLLEGEPLPTSYGQDLYDLESLRGRAGVRSGP